MKILVICKNCGIKWLRVIVWGNETVFLDDLQYVCPKCGSNWCEPILEGEVEE